MAGVLKVSEFINTSLKDAQPATIVLGSVVGTLVVVAASDVIRSPAEFKDRLVKAVFKTLKSLPGVAGEVAKEKAKIRKSIADELAHSALPGVEPVLVIPEHGLPHDEVLRRLKQLQEHEVQRYLNGKVSGAVYVAHDDAHVKLLNEAYGLFSLTNPLHADLFPSTRKFETEIVRMTLNMLNGPATACGNVTSGGSESILMAIKAYRDFYNKRNPEMIVPITAHAAFDKAAHYFGIKIHHAPLDADLRVNVKAVKNLINKNTIVIVGSAPNFPHGIIDPIRELAALAQKHNIGFHTDACLGGFYLPWAKKFNANIPDFDYVVPGVTSISIDTHKYGYATKGTSVITFRDEQVRRRMYEVVTEWPGGTYASPTVAGSRPGGLLACAWAALVSVGQNGYTEKARGIYEAAEIIKAGIKAMPEVQLVGESHSPVIALTSKDYNIYMINSQMSKRGWNLNSLHKPIAVHVCLTAQSIGRGEDFLRDLRESVDHIKAHPAEKPSGTAVMYGMAASFPDRSEVADVAAIFLDTLSSTS